MHDAKITSSSAAPVFISRTPFEHQRIGAAALYCSDGRYGEQMDEFLHQGLGLPRYDRVAVPGGAACLAGHVNAFREKDSVERQLTFLIREHELKRVVMIAHEGCGFYKDVWKAGKSLEQLQREDLRRSAEQIRLWNTKVIIEAYFARKMDGRVAFERWDAGM
jgi:hypothetical protein